MYFDSPPTIILDGASLSIIAAPSLKNSGEKIIVDSGYFLLTASVKPTGIVDLITIVE